MYEVTVLWLPLGMVVVKMICRVDELFIVAEEAAEDEDSNWPGEVEAVPALEVRNVVATGDVVPFAVVVPCVDAKAWAEEVAEALLV